MCLGGRTEHCGRLINSTGMNFLARQKKLREHLVTTRFDALMVSHLPNVRYLCGFTGSAGLLLVAEAGSVFFTDVRYDIQAHAEVKGAKGDPPGPYLLAVTSAGLALRTPLAPFRMAQAGRPAGDPAPLPYLRDAADQATPHGLSCQRPLQRIGRQKGAR